MTNKQTLGSLIASLTVEQAIEYDKQNDKLIWIETTLLDPNGISRRYAETVEDALIRILQDAWAICNISREFQNILGISDII